MNIFLFKNDQQFGPYTLEEVQAFLDGGAFSPIDSAWFEGCQEWTTVSYLPGIVVSHEMHRQHLVPPFEAYSGDQPFVFVSYSHQDGGLVFREIQRLHEAGYRIWYDEGIDPGKDWPEHIAQAVIDCSLFLMFTSPRSATSENCRNEVNLALNRKKKFLAVYLEDTELPPGLELRMGDLQAVLKYKMPDSTYRKKLFMGLESLLGEGGRDLPSGMDPVAEAMAVEVVADFLLAPDLSEEAQTATTAPDTSSGGGWTKWLGLFIGLTIATSCTFMAYLYYNSVKGKEVQPEASSDGELEKELERLREIAANQEQAEKLRVEAEELRVEVEKLRGMVDDASDLETYFAALAQAVEQEAYQEAAYLVAQKVLDHRDLCQIDNGQLNRKLLFEGSEEAWEKVRSGKLGKYPENSSSEYVALSSIVKQSGITDVWLHKLIACTVIKDRRLGRTFYSTKENFLQDIFSLGLIRTTQTFEQFDPQFNPQQNRIKVIQEGKFLVGGVPKNNSYESIQFAGGIQGKILKDASLTFESRFAREQIEEYLDEENAQIRAPLLDLLDDLIQDEGISLLFKACMHDELCRIMLPRGDQWGLPLSPRLKADHDRLQTILKAPLKVTDWMRPTPHQALEESLALFYENLDTRSYSAEADQYLNFLYVLSTVTFRYAGHLDELNQPRYLDKENIPAFAWCIALEQDQIVLQPFPGSNSLPFSPLLRVSDDLDAIAKEVLPDLREGTIELKDLIPFPYSTE